MHLPKFTPYLPLPPIIRTHPNHRAHADRINEDRALIIQDSIPEFPTQSRLHSKRELQFPPPWDFRIPLASFSYQPSYIPMAIVCSLTIYPDMNPGWRLSAAEFHAPFFSPTKCSEERAAEPTYHHTSPQARDYLRPSNCANPFIQPLIRPSLTIISVTHGGEVEIRILTYVKPSRRVPESTTSGQVVGFSLDRSLGPSSFFLLSFLPSFLPSTLPSFLPSRSLFTSPSQLTNPTCKQIKDPKIKSHAPNEHNPAITVPDSRAHHPLPSFRLQPFTFQSDQPGG